MYQKVWKRLEKQTRGLFLVYYCVRWVWKVVGFWKLEIEPFLLKLAPSDTSGWVLIVHTKLSVVFVWRKYTKFWLNNRWNFGRFRVISRKSCLAHVQAGILQNKFDLIKYHVYTKLCAQYQALEVTVACMAEILKGAWLFSDSSLRRSGLSRASMGYSSSAIGPTCHKRRDRCDKNFQKPTIRSQILRQGAPQDTTSYIHPLLFIDD